MTPVELWASEIVPPRTAEDGSGLAFAKGTRNDLKLIALAGTVIEVVKGTASHTMTLLSGDQTFTVTVPDSIRWSGNAVRTATKLKVTGVCLIAFDEYHRAQSFRLLVREPTDIVVVSRPPWLTLRLALWFIFPLVVIVLGALMWISVLRRHVASRTIELRAANARLRQLTVEDALTGAANRRRFDEAIRDHAACCHLGKTALSLVMIDLDYFKQMNDLYGHQRGDQCLIQLVGAVHRVLIHIPEAIVARYGGEEFGVLLPKTNRDSAAVLAEQMRRSVQNMAIYHERSPFDQRQTVSLGVATLSPGSVAADPDHLWSAWPTRHYLAKQSRRKPGNGLRWRNTCGMRHHFITVVRTMIPNTRPNGRFSSEKKRGS